MPICGYRRSQIRTIICWTCILLTAGILRLVLHWWRHLYLFATCCQCSLEEAEQVLITGNNRNNKMRKNHESSKRYIEHLNGVLKQKADLIDRSKIYRRIAVFTFASIFIFISIFRTLFTSRFPMKNFHIC